VRSLQRKKLIDHSRSSNTAAATQQESCCSSCCYAGCAVISCAVLALPQRRNSNSTLARSRSWLKIGLIPNTSAVKWISCACILPFSPMCGPRFAAEQGPLTAHDRPRWNVYIPRPAQLLSQCSDRQIIQKLGVVLYCHEL